MQPEIVQRQAEVTLEQAGWRFDRAAAALFPEYSRSRLQTWIADGNLLLDGETAPAREIVDIGRILNIDVEVEVETTDQPEAMDLDIVFEDEHFLIVNKPAGLVVHPGAGNTSGTLINGLLHHAPQTERLPRAGLVHRIDKDTTGLLVVAKTLETHTALVDALQKREITREYEAIVRGLFVSGGTIDEPIARDPRDRTKMKITAGGRESLTRYRILERFRDHTRLRLKLETGRTHQIRVHMASIRHPLVGDPVYGGRMALPKGLGDDARAAMRSFRRQALHARKLGLVHPITGESLTWQVPPPADMQQLIMALRQDADGLHPDD
ncbi:MAG: 23S rRNA pseudouridine1911/1915/1917 synthase [Pseudoalteromonas tetraodonis]|jgi:23S rRNA pseudouridine1911/1915/1917 synthase